MFINNNSVKKINEIVKFKYYIFNILLIVVKVLIGFVIIDEVIIDIIVRGIIFIKVVNIDEIIV